MDEYQILNEATLSGYLKMRRDLAKQNNIDFAEVEATSYYESGVKEIQEFNSDNRNMFYKCLRDSSGDFPILIRKEASRRKIIKDNVGR